MLMTGYLPPTVVTSSISPYASSVSLSLFGCPTDVLPTVLADSSVWSMFWYALSKACQGERVSFCPLTGTVSLGSLKDRSSAKWPEKVCKECINDNSVEPSLIIFIHSIHFLWQYLYSNVFDSYIEFEKNQSMDFQYITPSRSTLGQNDGAAIDSSRSDVYLLSLELRLGSKSWEANHWFLTDFSSLPPFCRDSRNVDMFHVGKVEGRLIGTPSYSIRFSWL